MCIRYFVPSANVSALITFDPSQYLAGNNIVLVEMCNVQPFNQVRTRGCFFSQAKFKYTGQATLILKLTLAIASSILIKFAREELCTNMYAVLENATAITRRNERMRKKRTTGK